MIPVIALAVGMGAMAVLAAGLLLEYISEFEETEQVRSASDAIQERRMREDIRVRFNHTGVQIESEWAGLTQITGIVVICDNGAIRSASLGHTVEAGRQTYLGIADEITAVRGLCT